LAGILTTRKLWAVDYRAQETDRDEFHHADQEILSLARDLALNTSRPQWERARLMAWVDTIERDPFVKASERLFITSFCERGDSPHMWTSKFSDCGAGFALEFRILREEYDLPAFGLLTMQVDYDPTSVLNRLRGVVTEILEAGRRARVAEQARPRAAWLAERQLWLAGARAAIQCKATRYAPDQEWRRVVTPRDPSEVLSTPRRVEVPIRDKGKLPSVQTIHIGPNAVADAEVRIAALLEEQGYVGALAPRVVRLSP
jgi:hypothetical protein